MIKYLATAAAVCVLAACQNTAVSTDNAAAEPAADAAQVGQCQANRTEAIVGTQSLSDEQISQATGASTVRRAGPNTALTMDYRQERITVFIDPASQKIVKAYCG